MLELQDFNPVIDNILVDVNTKMLKIIESLDNQVLGNSITLDLTKIIKTSDLTKTRALIEGYFVDLGKSVLLQTSDILIYDETLIDTYFVLLNSMAEQLTNNYTKLQQELKVSRDPDTLYLNNKANILNINGRNINSVSYVDRIAREFSTTQMLSDLQSNMQYYNLELVIVSNHIDCSTLCYPWQNRIYSIQPNNPKYPYFEPAKWRNGGGLFHPYCRHYVSVYVPNLTEPSAFVSKNAQEEGITARYNYKHQQRTLEKHKLDLNRLQNIAKKYKEGSPEYTKYTNLVLKKEGLVNKWSTLLKNNTYNAYNYSR